MVKKLKKILIGTICFSVALYLFLLFHYSGKKVHLSIDDVSICMKELTNDRSEYNSIFEQSFLKKLKVIHDFTDAKFTCYVYEQDGKYHINDFPVKYKDEFKNNSDWLKFGFHALNPTDSMPDDKSFSIAYNVVDSNLIYKMGGQSKALRLHYYYASQQSVRLLKSKGIKVLLSADDNRISYSLSPKDNSNLIKNGYILQNGLKYARTDIRVERDNIFAFLFEHLNDDELIVFTHEWALYSSKWKWKKEVSLIVILKLLNCKFIID